MPVSREDSQGDCPMPLQTMQRHTSIDMGGISKQAPAAPGSGLTRAASVGSPLHVQPRQQRGRTPSNMGESARMGDLCDMQVGGLGYAPLSVPRRLAGLDPQHQGACRICSHLSAECLQPGGYGRLLQQQGRKPSKMKQSARRVDMCRHAAGWR